MQTGVVLTARRLLRKRKGKGNDDQKIPEEIQESVEAGSDASSETVDEVAEIYEVVRY